MARPKLFKTQSPELSNATVASIRAAAHKFVFAGGSIFKDEANLDEHIANVDVTLHHDGDSIKQFGKSLADIAPDRDDHEAVFSAALKAISRHERAAFLFGAFVGLETAALMCGQFPTIAPIARSRSGKVGRR